MKTAIVSALACLAVAAAHAGSTDRITPQMQAEIDAQKKIAAGWAANPVLEAAAKAQNESGPIPGMTNRKWRTLSAEDPIVKGFEKNAAGVWLSKKFAASGGMVREAFLSGARGEKVAFVEKPSSYLHSKDKKFRIPMAGRVWQGEPEFDKSSYSYAVQIAVPVLSGGRPIGVLVVGLSMKMVKSMARPH